MTEKQMQFCLEYLKDMNATQAYLRVYKNVKNENVAGVMANRLLRNDKIKAYIDEKLEEIHNEKTADAKEVMEYLTSVLRGESTSETLKFSGNGYQDIVEKHPEEAQRLKAAELLGKRFGLFNAQQTNEQEDDVVIINDA